MFYETAKNDHGLPYNPFKAIVAPRPIGWITSVDAEGRINLAPYSFFNGVNSRPPLVMFASEGRKDSVSNIEETGEFVCNLASWDLREQMNETSAPIPHGQSEFVRAKLTMSPSGLVKPPRVAEAPCALECKLLRIVQLETHKNQPTDCRVVFGEVVGVYIDEHFVKDGMLDTAAMKPVARCGYADQYAVVERLFSMTRPET